MNDEKENFFKKYAFFSDNDIKGMIKYPLAAGILAASLRTLIGAYRRISNQQESMELEKAIDSEIRKQKSLIETSPLDDIRKKEASGTIASSIAIPTIAALTILSGIGGYKLADKILRKNLKKDFEREYEAANKAYSKRMLLLRDIAEGNYDDVLKKKDPVLDGEEGGYQDINKTANNSKGFTWDRFPTRSVLLGILGSALALPLIANGIFAYKKKRMENPEYDRAKPLNDMEVYLIKDKSQEEKDEAERNRFVIEEYKPETDNNDLGLSKTGSLKLMGYMGLTPSEMENLSDSKNIDVMNFEGMLSDVVSNPKYNDCEWFKDVVKTAANGGAGEIAKIASVGTSEDIYKFCSDSDYKSRDWSPCRVKLAMTWMASNDDVRNKLMDDLGSLFLYKNPMMAKIASSLVDNDRSVRAFIPCLALSYFESNCRTYDNIDSDGSFNKVATRNLDGDISEEYLRSLLTF